ncbi:polysaccharide biosynthesis/export family protein [Flavobacterium sp.]|uniref:polysaccharide biosynthesis/export family protein n=1 Tax=Flavobacterium sp. TaxID=239 RepID=UPI0028BE4A01|nr:polysaccharide biosynthesis/export family protein [Flavobacterium sp.]
MQQQFSFKKILPFLVVFTLMSCVSRREMVYLYNTNQATKKEEGKEAAKIEYESVLQRDDVLSIIISAENPEVAAPYNLKAVSISNTTGTTATHAGNLENYIIDKNGEIEFPQIGKIKLEGLTRNEAVEKLKEILSEYITNPTVHMRIVNFKISVIGEVSNPGMHTISSERITLLEALSLSGDLTIFGKRQNVMVIREQEGAKTVAKVDITNADFLNSEYYYLKQNDVVYVEPNGARRNASIIGPNITVGLSVLSFAIGIILLINK